MEPKAIQITKRYRIMTVDGGWLLAAAMLCSAPSAMAASPSHSSSHASAETPHGTHVLVVSLADRKLAVMEDGQILKVYDVAVGKASTPSPTGSLTIINKVSDPTYFHNGQVVKPGKSNPLGDRWMGLSQKGYGIHGTNLQSSVGKAASHGCFRMRKQDVEELFEIVRVGDAVEVRNELQAKWAGIFMTASQHQTKSMPGLAPGRRNSQTSAIRPSYPQAMAMMAEAAGNE